MPDHINLRRRPLAGLCDNIRRMRQTTLLVLLLATSLSAVQSPSQPSWPAQEEEILRHFQTIVRMDTTDPPGTPPGGEKPVAEYLKQVFDSADASLKRARELEPNNVAVLRGAALLAETLGRFDESGALLRQSLERDPLLPSGHAELGRVLLATGKLVAAEASLRTTLEIDPELLAAHAGIALTLL